MTGGGSGPFTPTDATYDPFIGDLVLFISGAGIQTHGLTITNLVTIAPTSISFTCSKDNYRTNHAYPRSTDPVAGIQTAITSTTTNSITVNVGKNVGTGAVVTAAVGVGGTLIFNVSNGGTNYKEPEIFVPSPSYDDMAIEGISRIGFGTGPNTGIGALISVEVGSSGLPTGIGSTLFSVKNFELSRTGYNFRKGDKFTPVGLVTDKSLVRATEPFVLEIEEVYEDSIISSGGFVMAARIKKGDTVMIVEAMKTMNHVPSTADGVVKEICVEDGQPVEFGQNLLILNKCLKKF